MHRMTSSLRDRPLTDTLRLAKALAETVGITRVTDTTWLDCIGIPVYASIRPDASPHSLCVNAGKGMHPAEAEAGAYMEAIEFAFAEFGKQNIGLVESTPRQVAEQPAARFEFVDLCPILRFPVNGDGPLSCVWSEDIATGEQVLIPAELVFHPFTENQGQVLFGTSTNGLCSGNSVPEATLHGLCEVMERDVRSFNLLRDRSHLVYIDDLGSDIFSLNARITSAGLTSLLRYTPNRFGLPFFEGYVLEPHTDSPISVAEGFGFHLVKEIAAVRALAEAAQSRLSYIHGGRDDLIDRFDYFAAREPDLERSVTQQIRDKVTDDDDAIRYSDIAEVGTVFTDADQALQILLKVLEKVGITQVLRVALTDASSELQVIKIIVPKLEHCQPTLKRVGPRLAEYALTEPVNR
jgi:ribosomal protein S12 methylthiotransferase accessory factor